LGSFPVTFVIEPHAKLAGILGAGVVNLAELLDFVGIVLFGWPVQPFDNAPCGGFVGDFK